MSAIVELVTGWLLRHLIYLLMYYQLHFFHNINFHDKMLFFFFLTFTEHGFIPSSGRQELADCVQCTPGMYCTPTGLSAPAGDCPGGYYCPLGTGPADSYPCPIGFYRNNSANEAFEVRYINSV